MNGDVEVNRFPLESAKMWTQKQKLGLEHRQASECVHPLDSQLRSSLSSFTSDRDRCILFCFHTPGA